MPFPTTNQTPYGPPLKAYIDEQVAAAVATAQQGLAGKADLAHRHVAGDIDSFVPSVSVDHGSVQGVVPGVLEPGTHEFDLVSDASVTVATTGDATLRAHGTGQVLTVAGEDFTIDGTVVIVVVVWPRGDQQAYVIGEAVVPVVPADPWAPLLVDTFDGAGDLTGHVVEGRTWAAAGRPSLILSGAGEATWSTHAADGGNVLPLNASHQDGIRCTVAYRPGDVEAAGSRFVVELRVNYTSTQFGNEQHAGAQLELQPDGTMTLSHAAPESLLLNGTLTGHPSTGTLSVSVVNTEIIVAINGLTVAAGTLPGDLLASKVTLVAANRSVALDDLVVETASVAQ